MKRHGGREVWAVSDVTTAVFRRFEDPPIPMVWVEAEIQDISRRRGQVRFRLVGDHSISGSMNAVVFDRLAHKPSDGALVQVNGRVQFYPPVATVSMRVERIELAGEGLLRARIAELMGKLRAEGLLVLERKRPLPLLPRRIGVVTSGGGAARHDIERTVARRHPAAGIVLVDSPV
ncbi:MAG: exodeoxyribonuclease VII large subunit, partial [Miltoncostaeaceae bacterium]